MPKSTISVKKMKYTLLEFYTYQVALNITALFIILDIFKTEKTAIE